MEGLIAFVEQLQVCGAELGRFTFWKCLAKLRTVVTHGNNLLHGCLDYLYSRSVQGAEVRSSPDWTEFKCMVLTPPERVFVEGKISVTIASVTSLKNGVLHAALRALDATFKATSNKRPVLILGTTDALGAFVLSLPTSTT